MAQLKPDEWPSDAERTTTENEVPASTPAAHEAATERAEAVMRDRLDDHPPVDPPDDENTAD
jgi:hypothetical protein